MSGSWAGAMGQLQFMPNIFYRYGVDGDADGRIDIWNSLPDIFHSAANFIGIRLARRRAWGRVMLPVGFDYSLTEQHLACHWRGGVSWSYLGQRQHASVVSGMEASVILPAGAQGPAFLGYQNFRTTMTYNPHVLCADGRSPC